jgi:hypothetical protein
VLDVPSYGLIERLGRNGIQVSQTAIQNHPLAAEQEETPFNRDDRDDRGWLT